MIAKDTRVPIFVYHSVSDQPEWLIDTHFSMPVDTFERQIKYLAENGYRTASLDEVYRHIKGEKPLKAKTAVLTFDDGYLDNWVAVCPILKKYNLAGTIFIPTDFVDRRDVVRKTLEDLWQGKINADDLEWKGYASWKELKIMESEGVLRVESHTKTHSCLFCSDRIIDFYDPRDNRLWVQWNEHSDLKPWWHLFKEDNDLELIGYPIFRSARSHHVKRAYLVNCAFKKHLNTFVRDNGGRAFFDLASWRTLLKEEMKAVTMEAGKWESQQEGEKRLGREFQDSREIIEGNLNKEARFLCWPGDEQDPSLEKLALRLGYQATTSLYGYNRVGDNCRRLARLYIPYCHRHLRKERLNYLSFLISLKLFEGNYFCYLPFLFLNALIKIINRTNVESR